MELSGSGEGSPSCIVIMVDDICHGTHRKMFFVGPYVLKAWSPAFGRWWGLVGGTGHLALSLAPLSLPVTAIDKHGMSFLCDAAV